MDVFYKTKNEEHLSSLKANYEKFLQCYDITTSSDILVEKSFLTVVIQPIKKGASLSIIRKENIEKIIEDLLAKTEDFCLTCGPSFYEDIKKSYCDISIVGTNYSVRFNGYFDKDTSNFSKSI